MTITVAKFVAAPAANPANAAISGTAGTAESIVAGDFASLLLGQLAGESLAAESAPTGKSGDQAAAETSDGTALADASQLFAALGLPMPPAGGIGTIRTAGADAAISGETRDTPRPLKGATLAGIQDTVAAASGKNDDAGRQPGIGDAGLAEATNSAGMKDALQAAAGAGNPAKLAGPHAAQQLDSPIAARENAAVQAAVTSPSVHPAASQVTAPVATDAALHVATPVKDAAWPAELSQKVVWMARQDLQSAQITLNPPQLGPIEISLDVKNDQASATFVSGNAEVREAIESALPRLREMLAGVGVELGQTNVSHESFRQAGEQNGNRPQTQTAANGAASERSVIAPATMGSVQVGKSSSGNGLVDTFA